MDLQVEIVVYAFNEGTRRSFNRASIKDSYKGGFVEDDRHRGRSTFAFSRCRHHLYAKKYQLPPEWAARIHAAIEPCAASVENPVERVRLVQYSFLKLWIRELDGYETRLLKQSIAHHRNFNRGVNRFVTTNPLAAH